MTDNELIEALVHDLEPVSGAPRLASGVAAFLLCSALSVLAFTRAGTAVSESWSGHVVFGLLVLMTTASAAAVISAIPGRRSWCVAAVASIVVLVAIAAAIPIRPIPASQIPSGVWGEIPWTKCFGFTFVFGAIPTATLVLIVRRAWTVQPRVTAAFTFLSGAAAGALTIAVECPSRTWPHELLGHVLPIASAAVVGLLLAGPVLLRRAVRISSN